MPMLQQIHLTNFLSFGPGASPIPLQNLNIVIGPNGAGKSNLIEAFEILRAAPYDLAVPIREGGGAQEWVWKGPPSAASTTASIDVQCLIPKIRPRLRYRIAFAPVQQTFELTDEVLENVEANPDCTDVSFYYRYQDGHPSIDARELPPPPPTGQDGEQQPNKSFKRSLKRDEVKVSQSIFSQRKDSEMYPELTATGEAFAGIQIFREWQFGRSAALRRPQPTDASAETLLPGLTNLGLVLNNLEHRSGIWPRLNEYCRRFLPRFSHLTTRIQNTSVQINLFEDGLDSPVPATRLSDGTIRFLALLAILLSADRHPLVCIEEPELGLHPDALPILADLLKEASEKTQLVVTTHSDALVSEFSDQPESVLVCEHMAGEGTTLTRLSRDKLAFWLEKYRLGEIWRIGEIGGNL
ncbi:MAG: AAA family ATPase [Opitutaceae bacterium]|jgi:predicted ATPase|nr:AAA family ATPase [Opitutaceae bacterium]